MMAGSQDRAVDFEALLRGTLWGFLFLAAVAIVIALLGPMVPSVMSFIELHDAPIRWIVYGIAALIAGFVAGARAGSMGLVHGALAAIGSTLLLALVSGVLSGTPNVWDLAQRLVLDAVLGGVGGVLGANSAAR